MDDFKHVNDAFGHAAGDDLLRVAAHRLAGCVRPADTVARLGGDEFAILLTSAPAPPEAEAVGRRITAALQAPIRLGGSTYSIAASIGMVVVEPGSGPVDSETLLHRADLAMYAAKARGGRGALASFGPHLAALPTGPGLRAAFAAAAGAGNAAGAGSAGAGRSSPGSGSGSAPGSAAAGSIGVTDVGAGVGADTGGGSVQGRLAVARRPVIDLVTSDTVAHDARLCWIPDGWIPDGAVAGQTLLADDTLGVVPALDRILLRSPDSPTAAAVPRAAAVPTAAGASTGAGGRLPVHITVSAGRAGQPGLVDDVTAALRAADIPPSGLVLQIRASRPGADPAIVGEVLTRIHASGVRIGLAEVGAPDTTLDTAADILRRVPVAAVSLHPALLHTDLLHTGTHRSPHQNDVVGKLARGVLPVLDDLGIAVIAEVVVHVAADGTVGDPGAVERLRAHGCRLAVGRAVTRVIPSRLWEPDPGRDPPGAAPAAPSGDISSRTGYPVRSGSQ
ncbi:diguanylate cyclase domain-containing protein [Parafrankia sp. FMc2]|uniref:diguanylate cyclase domain-containing protein n=1 Tax=Parafrankia sp. FMc2 TaxID=3233196 RepID=UPI0034D3B327